MRRSRRTASCRTQSTKVVSGIARSTACTSSVMSPAASNRDRASTSNLLCEGRLAEGNDIHGAVGVDDGRSRHGARIPALTHPPSRWPPRLSEEDE